MLIDFSVSNFRSIKDTVTLSAVAQSTRMTIESKPYRSKSDNEIAATFPVEGRGFEILPVLGVFGANASGKSNIVIALDYLLQFIRHGASSLVKVTELIGDCIPFRLDEDSPNKPTDFGFRALIEENIFEYNLSLSRGKVVAESLYVTPPRPERRRLLFFREWNSLNEKYTWKNGKEFSGSHIQLEQTIKDHEPFLGLLVDRLNVEVLKGISRWLRLRWPSVSLGTEFLDQYLGSSLGHEFPELHSKVVNLVRRFDTGISDIEVSKTNNETRKEYNLFAIHQTNSNHIRWRFEEESIGTQRLFSLAYKMLHSFEESTLLIADELGSNIHPNITRKIIQMFQSTKTNPRRAQLIFTSHDNTLQKGQLLRRDQIWFTQKRNDGSTDLYPLTDFKVRNDLAIDKAYLDGRFGAVPIINDEEELLLNDEVTHLP